MNMYDLKPLLNIDKFMLPNNMYTLKPIHSFSTNSDYAGEIAYIKPPKKIFTELELKMDLLNNTQTSAVCLELESRQESILQKLNDLKRQLMSMRSETEVCSSTRIAPLKESFKRKCFFNLVIHANPEAIPESLLCLSNIWKEDVNMDFMCYTHSTVAKLPDSVKLFQDKLIKATSSPNTDIMVNVKISLIWKSDINQPELVSSPAVNIPIIGEVNIIRYLCRLIQPPNQTNDLTNDAILDLCYQITNTKNLLIKQNLFDKLCSYFLCTYFGNNCIVSSIDAAAFSTINQLIKLKIKLPANIESWLKMMSKFC